jgi:pantoate--beta-alanine ligase
MLVFHTPAELAEWSWQQRASGQRVALVPTMGALHEGHLALVRCALEHADLVVVSVFVNPLQFNRRDDFDAYPRPLDDDLTICRAHGVHAVYAPTAATMYPDEFETTVVPGRLGEVLEGAERPGHFRGVATVVTKLFHAAQPSVAVFGEKDFQQLAVIRRMTADLDMPIAIVGMPTVREADGLAISSRNRRLSSVQREAAVCVPRMLAEVRSAFAHGEHRAEALRRLGARTVQLEPHARLEHLEFVDADTLAKLDTVDEHTVAVTAVWFGDVRLIDNCSLA